MSDNGLYSTTFAKQSVKTLATCNTMCDNAFYGSRGACQTWCTQYFNPPTTPTPNNWTNEIPWNL